MTALAVGVLSGAAPLAAPCAAAFAAATVGTLFDSASQAAPPSLVARDRLSTAQLAPSAYGSVLTGVAVGGVLGALLAPRLERRVGTGTVVLATVALTVAADVGLALTRSGPVAGVLLGGVGFAAFAFDVVSVSYRQSVVPDHLQGRVSSAHRVATWGIDPVGAAAAGVVAAGAGLPAVFRGAAVVLALAGLATARHLTTARLAAGLLA